MSKGTRYISLDDATKKILAKYSYARDESKLQQAAEDNFIRYVLPSLAEGEQRPLPPTNLGGRFRCRFPECDGMELKCKSTFIRHTVTLHGSVIPNRGEFLSPNSSVVRSASNPFVCNACRKEFKRRDNYIQHLNSTKNQKCAAQNIYKD
jgi:uncharacterized C2H2 Zn-finger protein